MIHLFKRVYITTYKLEKIIPDAGTVVELEDSDEFWNDIYHKNEKILLVGTDQMFSKTIIRFYKLLFPGVDLNEILDTIDTQRNNSIGFNGQIYSDSILDYLKNFKIDRTQTGDPLPLRLTQEDLGMEFLLLQYIYGVDVDNIIVPRLDRIFCKKVCGVMYDFKVLIINHLPSIARHYNIDILDSELQTKLIEKNSNFKYVFDHSWNAYDPAGMIKIMYLDKEEILGFYSLVEELFIRNRVDEWPMINGLEYYYGEPKLLLDALITQHDRRTRGWPGEEWFYQINKTLWALIISKKDDKKWLNHYVSQIKLNT